MKLKGSCLVVDDNCYEAKTLESGFILSPVVA